MNDARAPSDFLEIRITWEDRTAHGSTLSGRAQDTVRRRLYPVATNMLGDQMSRPAHERKPFPARELADVVRQERKDSVHRAIVADDAFWHPDPEQVRPAIATFRSSSSPDSLTVPLTANTIGSLRHALLTGETEIPGLSCMFDDIRRVIREAGFERPRISTDRFPATPVFVGHACVTWTDGDLRLWSDPFLRPKNLRYPPHYQPIGPFDVSESRHAIMITHSHPDHFDPGSLLLFPADTTIIVPTVEREDLLSLDLAHRLRQLGFTEVRSVEWGNTVRLGQFEITAVPFHGEQPLGGGARPERPERMIGNGYKIASAIGPSALVLADSGSDPWASASEAARRVRDVCGNVDIVFANHRRWRIYPPQYLTTSVPEFLCFVPDTELAIPQQIMYAPEDFLALAETLGAHSAIPYAMGGAAWFEEIGLGRDSLNPREETAFDAGPLDLDIYSDPDTLAVPGFIFVNALPGQGIGAGGELLWPEHMRLPRPDEFASTKHASTVKTRTLATGGPLLSPQLVSALFELSRLDPDAWFVGGQQYCELVSGGGEASEFLWSMVGRLTFKGVWRFFGQRPLCASTFASPPDWCNAFEKLHRVLFIAVRDAPDPIEAIRNIVGPICAREVPRPVVAAICKGWLNIAVPVDSHTSPSSEGSNHVFFDGIRFGPELPPQADKLAQQWGKGTVARSLLVVKTLHNMFVTGRSVGRGMPQEEVSYFSRILT